MAIFNKVLSVRDALEYIAFAVCYRDLPDNWDGKITCSFTDDGDVEILADGEVVETPEEDTEEDIADLAIDKSLLN